VGIRAIGYVRVSSEEQATSGLGLSAQRAAIELEVGRRAWTLVGLLEDAGASGKKLDGRPGLAAALTSLRGRQSDVLVVAKLDRLTRSVRDFAELLVRSTKEGWSVVALDIGVDTSTQTGEAMSHVVATFAQLERRLIGQRTKEALQQAKAAGKRLGAPIAVSPEVEARIVKRRREGMTYQGIADELSSEGIPTPRLGRIWRHATIRAILSRHSVPSFSRGRRSGGSSF
jgi:DNA invertase Pin-like site-specific DNA recombinase